MLRRSIEESEVALSVHLPELSNYRAPQTVRYYAERLTKLFPGEEALYRRYARPGTSILDIGIGGRTTRYLAENAKRYVEIDFSHDMIGCCRNKFPHLQFHVMDAAELSARHKAHHMYRRMLEVSGDRLTMRWLSVAAQLRS